MSLASETTAAEKNKGEQASAPHSSPVEPPPWHQIKASPQWQEAVRQTPGLKPFFDNLESFVELPEGVEKLREMVLELAVTGRLETQSNGDPSSNELLESLRSEKARRVKAKELKKGKPTPPIDAEEILHEVPNGWQWVRLQEFWRVLWRRHSFKEKVRVLGWRRALGITEGHEVSAHCRF